MRQNTEMNTFLKKKMFSNILDLMPTGDGSTGLKKLIRVRVIFIICLKLIIVDIKYY